MERYLRRQHDTIGPMAGGKVVRKEAKSVKIGYVNRNHQEVILKTGLEGTGSHQRVYVLRCNDCGVNYGANGCDNHLRKCPHCGGGRPGLSTDE